MLVKLVSFLRYAAGGGGLFIGVSMLSSDISKAVAITSLFAVGAVGVLSFVSHVILHEADAKRIGFSAKTVSFQFEVGFANLALGVTALVSYYGEWGIQANTALVMAYGLYLFQTGAQCHNLFSFLGKAR